VANVKNNLNHKTAVGGQGSEEESMKFEVGDKVHCVREWTREQHEQNLTRNLQKDPIPEWEPPTFEDLPTRDEIFTVSGFRGGYLFFAEKKPDWGFNHERFVPYMP